jgi:hypothetical protein
MRRTTFKSEVVYEADNEETGVLAQVITTPNIMWKFKVILHDMDAGELVEGLHKSFKTASEAVDYADLCAGWGS